MDVEHPDITSARRTGYPRSKTHTVSEVADSYRIKKQESNINIAYYDLSIKLAGMAFDSGNYEDAITSLNNAINCAEQLKEEKNSEEQLRRAEEAVKRHRVDFRSKK